VDNKDGVTSQAQTGISTPEESSAPVHDDTFEQAKTGGLKSSVFINCDRAEGQERPVKSAKRKLTRVPFTVSRLMEFCTRRELINQTGHDILEWPLVIVKELVDNSLDAAEEAEIAPVISIEVKDRTITISDNGPGIPAKTIDSILDYSIRVSSREAYCSPTRGAQGNALKTILPMGYVLDERGEQASGNTIIEAHGVAHHIQFSVDHIKQEPKIEHTTKASPVVVGTRIAVEFPMVWYEGELWDIIDYYKEDLGQFAESYAWLNPHLSLRVTWNGEQKIDIKASNPNWRKWLPSWPTCAHWYDNARFRRYMSAHIAHDDNVTVRKFISEFAGASGTAKQKMILAETGASHVSLHNYFGLHKPNTDNIAKLLAALKRHTKSVRPVDLGMIGKEHLYARMEAEGGDRRTFTYNKTPGETGGVPRVVEFAFGIYAKGLTAARGPNRKVITGVNWSPGINNPFRQLGRGGVGLDGILEQVRANTSQPVIAVLHLACPRVTYTDRGKSAIVVEGEGEAGDDKE
jgi:Histidine kinase-, DNA gyrase B-, and HSP90-like ATPase